MSFFPIFSGNRREILCLIRDTAPDLILISLLSDSFLLCREIVSTINTINIPIVLGGIHPTIAPEECINLDGVYAICRGEGEGPIADFVDAMESGDAPDRIKNMWVKMDYGIVQNSLRPLQIVLDEHPLPDYSIFREFFDFDVIPIIVSRGCPFDCSYCCNHTLRKIYGTKNYLRRHSVRYSIECIRQALTVYPYAREIEFFDDTFILDKAWLREFMEDFSRIGIPFSCNVRFDLVDKETIELLSVSGCIRINAAVESGNEYLRRILPHPN